MSLFKNKNGKLNIGQTGPNDFSSEGVAVEKKPSQLKRRE